MASLLLNRKIQKGFQNLITLKPQAFACGFLFAKNRKNSDGTHCFSFSVWA
nr:MAG TPA: hypothetical protein [Caudoviricetes sp.]